MDLKSNLNEICKLWIENQGYKTNNDALNTDYTLMALNRINRLIPQKPRKIIKSNEFRAPDSEPLKSGMEYLFNAVRNGDDLLPFMSRQVNVKKFGLKQDAMFNDWNIHHFHMGTTFNKDGMIKGNKKILFALLDDNNFYCIKITDHDFTNKELINIINNNWPKFINNHIINDILDVEYVPNSDELGSLRKNGINSITKLDDGKFILPPGGGITSAGGSINASLQKISINRYISKIEKFLDFSNLTAYMKNNDLDFLLNQTPDFCLVDTNLCNYFVIKDIKNDFFIEISSNESEKVEIKFIYENT